MSTPIPRTSAPTRKELEVIPHISKTRKKLERKENQLLFLHPIREVTGQTTTLKPEETGESRELQWRLAYLKQAQESHKLIRNLNGNVGKLLEVKWGTILGVKKFWESCLRRVPTFSRILPIGTSQDSHRKDQRKPSYCVSQEKGDSNYFEIYMLLDLGWGYVPINSM